MPLQAALLQSLPEGLILFYLGLVLVGVRSLGAKRVISCAVIYAVASYLIRSLPITYGIHSLLHIPVIILLMVVIIKGKWKTALVASLMGLLVLALAESAFVPVVSKVTNISIRDALADPWLRVIFPYPHLCVLGVITYFCYKKNICLIRVEALLGENSESDRGFKE